MECPGCGGKCEADFVDNGVGLERCGPWHCEMCQWIEPTQEADAALAFNLVR